MATITTTIAADIFGLAFANVQSCFTFSIVPPNLSYPSFRQLHSLPYLVLLAQLRIPLFVLSV